jgi:hypothetical protein
MSMYVSSGRALYANADNYVVQFEIRQLMTRCKDDICKALCLYLLLTEAL